MANPDMSKFPAEPNVPDVSKIKDPFSFQKFCIRIGAIPTNYTEALTLEEQLLYFIDYLRNTIIPAVNNNADTVNLLIDEFEKLYNYVHDYFDNLDVQEEVNNKIQEMVTSGELQEIITAYLQINGILGFNTIADMSNATNLIEGSFAKTFGRNELNDGYGQFYKVRAITSSDVIDGYNLVKLNNYPTLLAEIIKNADIDNLTNQISQINKILPTKLDEINYLYGDWTRYYIDTINGNENNNGLSEDSAFDSFDTLIKKVVSRGFNNTYVYFKSNQTYEINASFFTTVQFHFGIYGNNGNVTLNINSETSNNVLALYNTHFNFGGTENNHFVIQNIKQLYLDGGFIIFTYTDFNNVKFTLNGASAELSNCNLNAVSNNEGIMTINKSDVGAIESNHGSYYLNGCTLNPTKKQNNNRNSFIQMAAGNLLITGTTSVNTNTIDSQFTNFMNISNSRVSVNSTLSKGDNVFPGTNTFSNCVFTATNSRYTAIKNLVDGNTNFTNGSLYSTEITP